MYIFSISLIDKSYYKLHITGFDMIEILKAVVFCTVMSGFSLNVVKQNWTLCYLSVTESMSSGCQSGCLTCSEYNGCLSCKPRLFIFLERNGMKQTGVCLASCPSGYYGTRSPDRNDCTSKSILELREIWNVRNQCFDFSEMTLPWVIQSFTWITHLFSYNGLLSSNEMHGIPDKRIFTVSIALCPDIFKMWDWSE